MTAQLRFPHMLKIVKDVREGDFCGETRSVGSSCKGEKLGELVI